MALLQKLKLVSMTVLMALFVLSALTRIVSASLSSVPDGSADEVEHDRAALLCPPSDEVATLLEHIATREQELMAREEAAALREQDFAVARQEIEVSLSRLAEAEARLANRMAQSSTAAEDDVTRLVNVYEGMKPKDAALLFETMEPAFAAGFLARMNADAASALFSNLSPEKAYALSVLMAGRNANAARE
ncbi:MotE family protein [Jannaschia pohangensis]|uniref:Flagellar motility protein MotE, a chaperone for MotC folding n=1 Tax=Jannaschia pohangensis TaxID=390807 RepID=A0A1I3RA49_9RHOB|nr:hypothetical protein [Jannaschia pohangensis]SFJ42251.1 Flagellar motility protein MotE, a chaperone for MotC folding [Jannaschia pohangensis]